jgi:hypothetical protein
LLETAAGGGMEAGLEAVSEAGPHPLKTARTPRATQRKTLKAAKENLWVERSFMTENALHFIGILNFRCH